MGIEAADGQSLDQYSPGRRNDNSAPVERLGFQSKSSAKWVREMSEATFF